MTVAQRPNELRKPGCNDTVIVLLNKTALQHTRERMLKISWFNTTFETVARTLRCGPNASFTQHCDMLVKFPSNETFNFNRYFFH